MNPLNHLNFIPLDLKAASVDPEQIKRFMDNRSSRVNYSATEEINHPWNHVVVRSPNIVPNIDEKPGSGWRPDFKKKFPEVIKLVEQLPFTSIKYAYMLEQLIEVQPHFDIVSKHERELEPATYRITLLMEDKESFYICSNVEATQKKIPNFPDDTNSWVFSNKKFKHGSFLPKNNLRKILLLITGELDAEKHLELIKRSYDKYKEYTF